MGKGLPRSLSRRDPQVGVRDLAISVNQQITVDGLSGIGFGSINVQGLPEGNILLLGAVAELQFAGSGSDANLVDDWEGDFAIGSTPASDGTLTGTDVDFIASTALAAATGELSPLTRAQNATQAFIDNKAGDAEINVNLLIDDVDIDADGRLLQVTGQIHIAYIMLGDV